MTCHIFPVIFILALVQSGLVVQGTPPSAGTSTRPRLVEMARGPPSSHDQTRRRSGKVYLPEIEESSEPRFSTTLRSSAVAVQYKIVPTLTTALPPTATVIRFRRPAKKVVSFECIDSLATRHEPSHRRNSLPAKPTARVGPILVRSAGFSRRINPCPKVELLSSRLGLPCLSPPSLPNFWKDLNVREPEASFVINHAIMLRKDPRRYYSDADFTAFLAMAQFLPESSTHETGLNEVAVKYASQVAKNWTWNDIRALSSNIKYSKLLSELPKFSGILFGRNVIIKSSNISPWLSCFWCVNEQSGRKWDLPVMPNATYSLKQLGLSRDDVYMGSRIPYSNWFDRIFNPNEIRVMLLCKNCCYIQPFLREWKPVGFDAALVRPENGMVRVLELVDTGAYRMSILSEY